MTENGADDKVAADADPGSRHREDVVVEHRDEPRSLLAKRRGSVKTPARLSKRSEPLEIMFPSAWRAQRRVTNRQIRKYQ